MKLVMLIKMCLTEMCSQVWIGKKLSDMFSITKGLKQGDALSVLLFNFAVEYTIQLNQHGWKLNGTHQLLVYADDVNMLGESVFTIKKHIEALLVGSKVIGLEINADKTKYMVMSQDQNAGQSHNMKTDNSSFERAEQFKYLGTTLTNQNSIQEIPVRKCLQPFSAETCLPVCYPKI
jgi:RNA:NAD 2'-phosphotransferase (TPT1/KptA family)